jgi:hypothetical protein
MPSSTQGRSSSAPREHRGRFMRSETALRAAADMRRARVAVFLKDRRTARRIRVNYENPDRAPLLLVAASDDRTIAPSMGHDDGQDLSSRDLRAAETETRPARPAPAAGATGSGTRP